MHLPLGMHWQLPAILKDIEVLARQQPGVERVERAILCPARHSGIAPVARKLGQWARVGTVRGRRVALFRKHVRQVRILRRIHIA